MTDPATEPDNTAAEEGPDAAAPPRQAKTVHLPLASLIAAGVVLVVLSAGVAAALARHQATGEGDQKVKRNRGLAIDTFSHSEGGKGLGVTENGRAWAVLSGTWSVADGTARVEGGAGGPRVALLDIGGGDQYVAVTMKAAPAGSGIVFRFAGPGNFWSLTAAPAAGTWSLTKVVNGQRSNPTSIGPQPSSPGTEVAVRCDGSRIRIYINGAEAKSLNDPDLRDATRVGLIAAPKSAANARFDDIVAVGFGILKGGGAGGGGGAGTSGASGAPATSAVTAGGSGASGK